MNQPVCKHCAGPVETNDERCPNCGIPLIPGQHRSPQRRFIVFFIGVVLFCLFMIYWLPPDWSNFLKR